MFLKNSGTNHSKNNKSNLFTAILTVLFVFLPFGANFTQAQNCTPAPVGLVNWYPAEGSTNDIRGGENGTPVSTVTYSAGKVGQAFNFTNNSGQVNAPAAISYPTLTIASWVYINGYNGNFPTLFERGSGINRIGLSIVDSSGSVAVINGGNFTTSSAPGAIPLNQWVFVALTVADNGPNKDLTVYVNGSVVLSVTNTTISSSNSGTLAIGGTQAFPGSNLINGLMDETQFFNRALSQIEIQAIYNAGSAGLCAIPCAPAPVGLAAWLPFDAASPDSTHTVDIRGGTSATLSGAASFQTGKVTNALVFDGTSTYVKESASPSLNVGTGAGLTIDAWINPTDVGSGYRNIAEWNDGSNTGTYFYQYFNQLYFSVVDTAGNQHYFYAGTLTAGIYQHVAATYDKASGMAAIYINGQVQGAPLNIGSFTPQTSYDLYFGVRKSTSQYYFLGAMDEMEVFNRALSPSEIQAIYNAGSAGKCKPTAVTAPSNLAAWYAGDGDGRDLKGGANLTFTGNVGYSVGKVSQAFNLPGGYLQGYATTPTLNLGNQFSVEVWFNPTDLQNGRVLLGNSNFGDVFGSLYFDFGPNLYYYQNSALRNQANSVVQAGVWTHAALTYDGSVSRLYVNGTLIDTSAPHVETFNTAVRIGQNFNESGGDFKGKIDEPSFYNRALTATEIQSIYNAGLAGKLKTAPTGLPPLSIFTKKSARKETFASFGTIGTTTQVGDATITFPSLTASGITQEIPLNLALFPTLPAGNSTGLTYDIATSAVYSGSPTVCFNLPSFTAAQFPKLRIYHLEGGAWVNRTNSSSSYPNLCTSSLTSLSPFAIAMLAPTAANVSVSGRVFDSNGNYLSRAIVSLTDSNGQTRTVKTNSFGNYSVDGVAVGESYVVSVSAKGFQFSPQIVNVLDNINELDFTALPQ